jgi:hypothetical protein
VSPEMILAGFVIAVLVLGALVEVVLTGPGPLSR